MTRLLPTVLLALLALAGCRREPRPPVTRPFTGMGTVGSLILPADAAAQAPDRVRTVVAVVSNLEARMSIYNPDSELSRLNAAAGEGAVELSPDVLAMLGMGLQASRDSGGAFDMTVGPLMTLWGFRGTNGGLRVPSDAERAEALRQVGPRHVSISGTTARLLTDGVRLDPGGIGKGYAVDRCWDRLRSEGADRFLMNLGGNMRASGRPESGRPWTVGVRHPFRQEDILGTVRLEDGMAVATSGHYERFVTIGGVRYAHIMDPRTGMPVQGMAGVTVVASSAAEADILSTTLFVMGPEAGLAMLARTGRRAEVLVVPDRQPLEVLATAGMLELFEPEPGVAPRLIP